MDGKVQYLCLAGILYPDNRLELKPGYLTDHPYGAQEDPDSPLVAELYNREDKLLLRYHVPATPFCIKDQTVPELAVVGKIPFPPATRVVRFYRDSVMVHEITVTEGKPEISLMWEPPESVEGRQTITWAGRHPEDRPSNTSYCTHTPRLRIGNSSAVIQKSHVRRLTLTNSREATSVGLQSLSPTVSTLL
jgi:hypothetical protein